MSMDYFIIGICFSQMIVIINLSSNTRPLIVNKNRLINWSIGKGARRIKIRFFVGNTCSEKITYPVTMIFSVSKLYTFHPFLSHRITSKNSFERPLSKLIPIWSTIMRIAQRIEDTTMIIGGVLPKRMSKGVFP